MSEYQYYEFQAIDRPLTPAEQKAVARLSSRVDPHPTRAIFTYNYSDFPGDALDVLARYYDAMFYIANWGSVALAFRFPQTLIDVDAIRLYCVDPYLTCQESEEYVVLSFSNGESDPFDYWVEGEGTMAGFLPLREAILGGDYRVLYLAWLTAVWDEWELEDEAPEPPVPPGLQSLSAPLQAFVDLFTVDKDLLALAAAFSPDRSSTPAPDVEAAIGNLSPDEQQSWLGRLAQGEVHLSQKFNRRLGEITAVDLPTGKKTGRTAGDLRQAVEASE